MAPPYSKKNKNGHAPDYQTFSQTLKHPLLTDHGRQQPLMNGTIPTNYTVVAHSHVLAAVKRGLSQHRKFFSVGRRVGTQPTN